MGRKPFADPKIKQDIVLSYHAGESVISIAKRLGLSRERIYQYLRSLPEWDASIQNYRMIREMRQRDTYRKYLRKVTRLREQGVSMTEVARRLHIKYKAVYLLLHNTRLDSSHKMLAARDRRVQRQYLKGLTQKEIAQKMGLRQTNVSRILRKLYNGKLPKRPRAGS